MDARIAKWNKQNSRAKRRGLRACLALFVVLAALALVAFAPFTARLRSLAVVSAYDAYCQRQSLPRALGIVLRLPLREAGFYPVLVTYNDDAGMSAWLGKDVRFTVDYAIADYAPWSDASAFYNPDSPWYGAYVGAYYLQGLGRPADEQTAAKIAEFDQRFLALPAVGCPPQDAVFRVADVRKTNGSVACAGLDWLRYDAALTTNAPDHAQSGFSVGSLLFGNPPPAKENYPLRRMAGRFYLTYFSEADLTVGLYILARDEDSVCRIDETILKRGMFDGLPTGRPDGMMVQ